MRKRILIIFVISALPRCANAVAQDSAALLPDTTCVLEVLAPADAKVVLGGRDYGDQRRFTYRELEPGKRYSAEVQVQFPDDSTKTRKVYLKGGQHIRLPISVAAQSRPELILQGGLPEELTDVAFSPDGRQLLLGFAGGHAVVWDIEREIELRRFRAPVIQSSGFLLDATDSPTLVRFGANGADVVTVYLGTISVWQAASGRLRHLLRHRNTSFSITDRGTKIVTGQFDGKVTMWDLKNGELLRELSISQGDQTVSVAAISRDGNNLLIEEENKLTLWDAKRDVELRELSQPDLEYQAAVFTPDDRQIVIAFHSKQKQNSTRDPGKLIVWDVETGEQVGTYPIRNYATQQYLSFQPDGSRLALLEANEPVLRNWESGDATSFNYEFDDKERERIHTVSYSPGGDLFLTVTGDISSRSMGTWSIRDWQISLWSTESGARLKRFAASSSAPEQVAISSDASQLLATFADVVSVFDIIQGTLQRSVHQKYGDRYFSLDGQTIVTRDYRNNITLTSSESGEEIAVFKVEREQYFNTEFVVPSPDGRWIVTVEDEGYKDPVEINLRNSNGEKIRTLETFPDLKVRHITFSRDSSKIAAQLSGSTKGKNEEKDPIVVWETTSGKQLYRVVEVGSPFAPPLLFAEQGKSVLSADGSSPYLWDLEQQTKQRVFGGFNILDVIGGFAGATGYSGVRCLAISPDQKEIVLGGDDGELLFWRTSNGEYLRRFDVEFKPNTLTYSPNGRLLFVGGQSYRCALRDVDTGKLVRELNVDGGIVVRAAFSPDGRRLFTVSYFEDDGPHGFLMVWDVASGRRIHTIEHDSFINALSITPDGKQGLYGLDDGSAIIADMTTGKDQQTFKGHEGLVVATDISPDGKLSATSGIGDWSVLVRDLTSGRTLQKVIEPGMKPSAIRFHPNGEKLFVAGWDGVVTRWDVQTGEKDLMFVGHDTRINDLQFLHDSQHLVTISNDGSAVVWNSETGQEIYKIKLHGESVISTALSQNEKTLVSGDRDRDGTAIVWNVDTGGLLRRFQGHSGEISSVDIAPNDRTVVTGSTDGTIRLWDIATGDHLLSLIRFNEIDDWLVTTPEGLFDGSPGGREKVTFRIGEGLNVVPVDRFFQDFYYPGLLAAIYRGERPMPEVQIGRVSPPKLAITSHESGVVDSRQVELTVEADDQGGGIARLALFQNGARLLAPGETRREGDKVVRTFQVALVEGRNEIRVTASSSDGSWEAEPAEVVLTFERPLDRSKLFVVAIGVNDYQESSLQLKYAATDAREVAKLFEQRGPTLYESVHATALVDGQASKSAIQSALQAVAKQAQPQDTLVVFVAGHGITLGQRYYFLPVDFQQSDDQLATDVRRQGLPHDLLGDWMAAVPALKRILILDTCQSGGAITLASAARNPFAFRGAIERLSRAQGIYTIAASAANDDAQEIAELGHGVLTYSLLAGLGAVADGPLIDRPLQSNNPERVADVLEWFSYASGHVPRLTGQFLGSEQQVQTSGQGASFPVLPLDP